MQAVRRGWEAAAVLRSVRVRTAAAVILIRMMNRKSATSRAGEKRPILWHLHSAVDLATPVAALQPGSLPPSTRRSAGSDRLLLETVAPLSRTPPQLPSHHPR